LEGAGLITFDEESAGSPAGVRRPIESLIARIEDEVVRRGSEPGLVLATETISENPGNGILFLVRGRIQRDRGRHAEAEGDFRDALRADPLLGAAHRELGEALAEQGKFDEALEWLERWLGTRGFTQEEPDEVRRVEEIVKKTRTRDA
jgi:tetratricopeptide (TPR) repeat protein